MRVGAEFRVVQVPAHGGGEERPGGLDGHAVTFTIGAPGPAGVHQPAGDIMRGDKLAKQIAIDAGMARNEGRAEAGGEGGHRFHHPLLGARHLGGVTGEIVIHGLLRRELCQWRQHTEGVGREHHDVPWHAGLA